MSRTMFIHDVLRCYEDKLSTNIFPMEMNYDVGVYNRIPDIQSGSSAIEIWPRSRFDLVSEALRKCNVWGCPTYVLEPNFQKPGANIPK